MSNQLEDIACKHCGRCVLAGPPCCYDSVLESWQKLYAENLWLRKIQGKQTKQIQALQEEIDRLKANHE